MNGRNLKITLTQADWREIRQLTIAAGMQPPTALAEALLLVDAVHAGDEAVSDLSGEGLDLTRWTSADVSSAANWLLTTVAEIQSAPIRRFHCWLIAMIIFELECRALERQPLPAPAPAPHGGRMN